MGDEGRHLRSAADQLGSKSDNLLYLQRIVSLEIQGPVPLQGHGQSEKPPQELCAKWRISENCSNEQHQGEQPWIRNGSCLSGHSLNLSTTDMPKPTTCTNTIRVLNHIKD